MATKKISDLSLRSSFDDTCNLPSDDATQTWRVTGAQIKAYIDAQLTAKMKGSRDLIYHGIACSVGSSALTISLKQLDGTTDPTSTNPVKITFRNSTVATGDQTQVSAIAATSLVISSGSTMGMSNAVEAFIYVYAMNNGGTIELAASRLLLDEGTVWSTTAEGGAGAADSATAIYSTTSRSSKAMRLIGRLRVTEATAGTWATAPSEISLPPFSTRVVPTVQRFTSGSGTYTTPVPAPLYLVVKMVGSGAGGMGSGTTNGTSPSSSTSSVFGTSLLIAPGGGIGARGGLGGAGFIGTINSPAIALKNVLGGSGGAGSSQGTAATNASVADMAGGDGGNSALGGGASGGVNAGGAGAANTGGGGGGGASASVSNSSAGAGGGAGAYIEAIIPNPGTSYAYVVGVGGTAGAAGSSGFAGGAGADGVIEVIEYYQ